MNEILPVIIMMNNYFHDVATALLAVSAFTFLGLRKMITKDNKEVYIKLFHYLTKLALVSLVWIILGGIPRVIFFKKYEWWDAASKGIIPALIVKHIVMFFLVGCGIYLWLGIRKSVKKKMVV